MKQKQEPKVSTEDIKRLLETNGCGHEAINALNGLLNATRERWDSTTQTMVVENDYATRLRAIQFVLPLLLGKPKQRVSRTVRVISQNTV